MSRRDAFASTSSADGRPGFVRLILPVAVLVVVVAVVSVLVLTGVVQGGAVREGPLTPATTQPSVIILPR